MADEIHLFRPTFRVEECLEEIRECLEKGWTGLGFKTIEFEQAWCEYSGFEHSHFLSSATAGLHLAVALLKRQFGWNDGDEIITTPITFVSTNHAILYERLQPVFADVDEYLCLDPESVAEQISPRTRAVMFVGIGGNVGRYGAIREICSQRGLGLILDASHMAGTWAGELHAGRDSDVAVFSFQAVKNLPTADSGMICFQDPILDREVRKWTWLGIDKDTFQRTVGIGRYKWRYEVENVGFKYHGNSVMAALGLVGLRYVEADNAARREIAAWYDEELTGMGEIDRVPMAPECRPSRHLYQILVEWRDDVMIHLNERGIFPGVHYRDNRQYPMYAGLGGNCPRASAASERVISLPNHVQLRRSDVARVGEELRQAVR